MNNKIKELKDLFEEKINLILKTSKEDQIKSLVSFKKRVVENIDSHITTLLERQDLIKEAIKQKKHLKQHKESLWYYITHQKIRHLLSVPFIYVMIFPAIVFHVFLETYHRICFFLYKIPFVKYSDFFVFDRGKLSYLNILEKLNCWYCSYLNGLMSYAVEIAGRTEKYWCPIKHAKRRSQTHVYYDDFFEYLDGKGYREELSEKRCFDK